jgi:hypothetical protein
MCFSRPSPPQITYQGPSDADIKAQRQAMDAFMQQSQQQQSAMAAALQSQIESVNRQAQQQAMALAQQQAAGTAPTQVQAVYGVDTTQATPTNAQVTEPITPRKPEEDSLRISPGSVAVPAGSGLNIGV